MGVNLDEGSIGGQVLDLFFNIESWELFNRLATDIQGEEIGWVHEIGNSYT